MPPFCDDAGISGEHHLLRALPPYWVVTKQGRERPTSNALLDSNFENSCFVEGEISLRELCELLPGCRFARIPVSLARSAGYIIERRPLEAPEGCTNPESHVVIGPRDPLSRGDYEKASRMIVKNPAITIIDR
jgi:hypothetical protein